MLTRRALLIGVAMPLILPRRYRSVTPKPSGSTILGVGDSITDKQFISSQLIVQGQQVDTVATRFGYTRVGAGVSGGGSHTAAVAGVVTKSGSAVATVPITTAGTGYVLNPYVIFAGGTPTTQSISVAISNGTGLTSVVVFSGGNYAGVPTASFSFSNDSTRGAISGAVLCDGSALGFPAATVAQYQNLISSNITVYAADVVVIYLGTNDLIQSIQNATTYPANFTPAKFKTALQQVVTAVLAQANKPLIVLCTLPPVLNIYNSLAFTFSGGGGSGANAVPVVTNGVVTGFTSLVGGSGYTSAPAVAVSGSGSGATASCTIAANAVNNIVIGAGGTGYGGFPSWATSRNDTHRQYNDAIRMIAIENRCALADFSGYNYAIGSTAPNDIHAGPVGQAFYADQITAAIMGAT
jgi:lysophospholipase L1-like esterase